MLNVCVTPSVQNRPKKPLSIRRKRSPVALKLPKINIIWSDDEDDNSSSSPLTTSSPPLIRRSTRKSKFPGANLATRKILEEHLSDDVDSNRKNSTLEKTELERDLNGDNIQNKSMKDVMMKVAPLVPDISETLMDLINDKSNVPATMENIDELIEKVESLKISSSTTQRRRNVKDKTKLTAVEHNNIVNRALELLKNVAICEKVDENIDPVTPTQVNKQTQNQSTVQREKKFFKTGLLQKHKEDAKLHVNDLHSKRATRSSIKRKL